MAMLTSYGEPQANKMPTMTCSTANDKNVANGKAVSYTEEAGIVYTVDDAVNHVGYGKFQIRVICLAGFGFFADALEIILLSLLGNFIACEWVLYKWQNALLTTVVFGGMMIGSPILGVIADIYGRRMSLGVSAGLMFLFGALTAASPSFMWIAILRCCTGFALGGVAQCMTLCSEYSPSNMRGKVGFYVFYFFIAGIIVIELLAWVVMDYLDNWRILLLIASIPALLVIFSMKWYPESARYYLVSNQYDRAKKTLERMAKMNGKELPPGNLIRVPECSKRGRFRDLLNSDHRKTALLFWYIWFSISFTYYGIIVISPIIVQSGSLRLSHATQNLSSNFLDDMVSIVKCTKFSQQNYIDLLWTSASEFPGLLVFMLLIERCSRKVLMGATCGASGVLLFLLLIKTSHKFIILLFLFGIRAIIASDLQFIYVMVGEAFPTTLRAIAVGTGCAFGRLGGAVVPYVAQVLVVQNPVTGISVMAIIILLAAVATALLPLETRGLDMKESHTSTD